MNILYCGDKGISKGVLVSILSLMKNCEEPLEIYIMTIGYEKTVPFPKETVEFLDFLVKNGTVKALSHGPKYPEKKDIQIQRNLKGLEKKEAQIQGNPKSFVKLIDATEVFVKDLPGKNMGSYFTPASMLRLYLARIPELSQKDRLLYLDYDVVCRKDLKSFYHQDLKNIEAVGALDIYGQHFYHYHGLCKKDYMNSGVMLFNIPECIRSGMFDRAISLCKKRWMMLADQAALNKAIKKRKIAERKYNEQSERPKEDTVLHHFSNNFKFWPYFRVQKVKPFEIEKIHRILKIHEYDAILKMYSELEGELDGES